MTTLNSIIIEANGRYFGNTETHDSPIGKCKILERKTNSRIQMLTSDRDAIALRTIGASSTASVSSKNSGGQDSTQHICARDNS